jgi:CBS-domain-containing membrane protein
MGCAIHAAKRIVPTRRKKGRQGTTIEDCHKGRQDVRDDDISEMTRPISDLVTRSAVSIYVAATIQDAACHMHANDVSCVLIVDDTTMRGIVTDRDIRNRAAADGQPVSDATLFGQTLLLQQNQKIITSNSQVKPPQ